MALERDPDEPGQCKLTRCPFCEQPLGDGEQDAARHLAKCTAAREAFGLDATTPSEEEA